MTRAALVAAALVAAAAPAHADVNLRLERQPPPRDLRIRPRAAQAAPPPATPRPARPPMPAAPKVSATSPDRIDGLEGVRDALQPLTATFNLGYQIDGARESGRAPIGGTSPRIPGVDYATLRAYGFGEAFLGTRGLGAQSLQTYFAGRLQIARQLRVDRARVPDPADPVLAPPIATWFERSGPELRTGWAELHDFLPAGWGLQHLRVRAGDQFIYGPWIVHLTGVNIAYEGPALTLAAYGGQRRADYQRALENNQPIAIGASFKLDLRGLTTRVPLAFAAEYLTLTASDVTAQPASESAQLQLDWRPRKDIAVIAQQRWLDGELANQHVEVRARYKDVTNVVFEAMRRHAADWRWDPTLVIRSADITEARRYLDLGPVVPQLLLSARGGTLIAENLDLSARIAVAPESGATNPVESGYAASYLELGGALEARVRRQIAVGASVLSRDTRRLDQPPAVDLRPSAQPLPPAGLTGEDGFLEIGTTVRLTLGARRASALIELYGRRTRYTEAYVDPILPLPEHDVRGGGRFTIDAWVGRRIRLFASYDVSTELETAPEISGYKSLRLVASGVY